MQFPISLRMDDMDLLKTTRFESFSEPHSDLSTYIAWLKWIDDWEFRTSILSSNINIIRRELPFAFFLQENPAPDYSLERDLGYDLAYLSSLDRVTVKPESGPETLVMSIQHLDALPFTSLLETEGASLLCLNYPTSLRHIIQAVRASRNEDQLVAHFEVECAANITIVDGVRFSVVTHRRSISRYFQPDQSGPAG